MSFDVIHRCQRLKQANAINDTGGAGDCDYQRSGHTDNLCFAGAAAGVAWHVGSIEIDAQFTRSRADGRVYCESDVDLMVVWHRILGYISEDSMFPP